MPRAGTVVNDFSEPWREKIPALVWHVRNARARAGGVVAAAPSPYDHGTRRSQPRKNSDQAQPPSPVASGSPLPPSLARCIRSPSFHGPLAVPPRPPPPPKSYPDPRELRAPTRHPAPVPPSRNGSSAGTDWCPVPPEQRPVNEYEALAASLPLSWAAGDLRVYCSCLAFTGAAFAIFVGLPVAAGATLCTSRWEPPGPESSPSRSPSCGCTSGWAYVWNRLLSATVEYEETGWYDGQRPCKLNHGRKRLVGMEDQLESIHQAVKRDAHGWREMREQLEQNQIKRAEMYKREDRVVAYASAAVALALIAANARHALRLSQEEEV